MKIKSPEFTKNELQYIATVLREHRDIQTILGKIQDKQYAPVVNKLTNYFRALEGKDPL